MAAWLTTLVTLVRSSSLRSDRSTIYQNVNEGVKEKREKEKRTVEESRERRKEERKEEGRGIKERF